MSAVISRYWPALAVVCAACGHQAAATSAADAVVADTAAADVASLPDAWAVGLAAADWTDNARDTPANGDEAAHAGRHLPVQIWYPASGPAGGAVSQGATPAQGQFPLVLFVHGSSGTTDVYAGICWRLAALGYVVAAAEFPLTSLTTPGGPSDWHAEEQQRDLIFLGDQMLGVNVPPSLAGHVTPGGYAVVGHSTGGTIALLAAYRPDGHDDRVQAVVDISGDSCWFDPAFFTTRSVPLLAIGATDDLLVPPSNNPERAFALASPPAVLAVIKGGTHLHMTELAIDDPTDDTPTGLQDPLAQTMAQWGTADACRPVPPPGQDAQLAQDDQKDLAAAIARAFLDAHMKGAPSRMQAMLADPDPRRTLQLK